MLVQVSSYIFFGWFLWKIMRFGAPSAAGVSDMARVQNSECGFAAHWLPAADRIVGTVLVLVVFEAELLLLFMLAITSLHSMWLIALLLAFAVCEILASERS